MKATASQAVGIREHAVATPGEFRQIIAGVLDMPVATVTSFDRLLSEAGLRSKAGRGRGAATITARDATHLLLAIMASAQVREAAHSVERYAATRLHRTTSTPGAYASCGIAEFQALTKDHSFMDAVEALILWIAGGTIRTGTDPARVETIPMIEVMATTPSTIGDIRISGIGDSVLAVRYTLPTPWNEAGRSGKSALGLAEWQAANRDHAVRADLEQFRRISGRTLFQVGEVLANDR